MGFCLDFDPLYLCFFFFFFSSFFFSFFSCLPAHRQKYFWRRLNRAGISFGLLMSLY